jgi:hypothetical protein
LRLGKDFFRSVRLGAGCVSRFGFPYETPAFSPVRKLWRFWASIEREESFFSFG